MVNKSRILVNSLLALPILIWEWFGYNYDHLMVLYLILVLMAVLDMGARIETNE